ncbi:MAG: hypothetical protein J5492_01130, partial [Oxalobacter sp.]|nr:hypothetical protein [Oxalobacter sp.]
KASGLSSTAFGIESHAQAENSLAALGGTVVYDESDQDNIVNAKNSAAIGKGAKVTVSDTVALGSGSEASREAGATDAYMKGSNTGRAWVSTHNAIAVGNDDIATRQITGVAAGSKDTDVVNVAQLKAAISSGGTVYEEGNGISFEEGKKITVNAGDGLAFDTENGYQLKVNAGDGLDIESGVLQVNASDADFQFDSSKLQLKKDGKVEKDNTGVVTGGTVYDAVQAETRVSEDGHYIKKEGSAAANLTALDRQVAANTKEIGKKADADSVYTKDEADKLLATKADKADLKTAQSTAEAAQSAAETAQNTAKQAVADASKAQSAAETAQSAAETAQNTAKQAVADASKAQSTAEAAQSAADAANTAAEAAQKTADKAADVAAAADTKAEDAKSTANEAKTVATEAQSTAGQAAADALAADKKALAAQTIAKEVKSGMGTVSDGNYVKGDGTIGDNINTLDKTLYDRTRYFTSHSTEDDARATGQNAIAVGPRSQATGEQSLAVGYRSTVTG